MYGPSLHNSMSETCIEGQPCAEYGGLILTGRLWEIHLGTAPGMSAEKMAEYRQAWREGSGDVQTNPKARMVMQHLANVRTGPCNCGGRKTFGEREQERMDQNGLR